MQTHPYAMIEQKEPNTPPEEIKYIGYVPDIVAKIADIVGFEYELYFVPDGKYGSFENTTKKWNGMIGELKKWEVCLEHFRNI